MKKILLFIFLFFSFTAFVTASTKVDGWSGSNIGYCEYDLNDAGIGFSDISTAINDYDMKFIIEYDTNSEKTQGYYLVEEQGYSNYTTVFGINFRMSVDFDSSSPFSYEELVNNNSATCPDIKLQVPQTGTQVSFVHPSVAEDFSSQFFTVKHTKHSEPDSGNVTEDEIYYEATTIGIIDLVGNDTEFYFRFTGYESGKVGSYCGNDESSLEEFTSSGNGTYSCDFFDGATTQTVRVTTQVLNTVHDTLVKQQDSGKSLEIPDLYLNADAMSSSTNFQIYNLELEKDEDSLYPGGETDNETYLKLNGEAFARVLGSLKNALDEVKNLPSVITEFQIGSKNFEDYESNEELCTDSECKESTEYYISSGIRDVVTYCNNNLPLIVSNGDYTRRDECINFISFYEKLIEENIIDNIYGTCGFISIDLANFLNRILGYIAIFAPILAVLLGTLDFIKVIANGDAEKEMKSAFKKFMIRIGMAIALIIAPVIISFILNLFALNGYNLDNPFCGLEYSIHNIEDEE